MDHCHGNTNVLHCIVSVKQIMPISICTFLYKQKGLHGSQGVHQTKGNRLVLDCLPMMI